MRYIHHLNNADNAPNGGYSGPQTGSGRNSGEQEQQSWKDSGNQSAFDGAANENRRRNESDGNSNLGDHNTLGSAKSTQDNPLNNGDIRNQLDNSL